jgi:ribose transport system substrate-binding protein
MLKKLLISSVAVACFVATGAALADTKDKKIALSNNYAGNSWRQAMLKSCG